MFLVPGCGIFLTLSCVFRLLSVIFSAFFVPVFLLGDVHKVENMYAPLSFKAKYEGESNDDVLAFGRMVKLDQSLSSLLGAGDLQQ